MPKCFFFSSPAFEGLVWKWLTLFKRVSRGGCKQIHREAHSIHFLHPPPNSYSICVVLQWVFQKLLSSLCTSLSSPLLCVCFTCAAVTTPPPLILLLPSFLHSPVSVSLVDSFSSQPAEAEQCWDEHPKRNEDGKH